jgi:arginyl-tRNA synthetase
MSIVSVIQKAVIKSLQSIYSQDFTEKDFQINQTKPEFEGDYTVVLFSLVKSLKTSPDTIGNELGNHLVSQENSLFTAFNIIKGFLNLTIKDEFWITLLEKNHHDICFGKHPMNGQKVMVEYSSPNLM